MYRVRLPKHGRLTAILTGNAALDLSLRTQGTVSVVERLVGRDRLARALLGGASERLTFTNTGVGRYACLAVVFGKAAGEATYTCAWRTRVM